MRPQDHQHPCALLITGTVGAGKTTTAAAAGDLLAEVRVPHAVIDLDALRQSWPSPPNDPFNLEMELLNLQAVASNYLAAGAQRLLLSGVVEHREERERCRTAVGVDMRVCRLRVGLAEVHRRLESRHVGADAEKQWHLNRAGELDQILDAATVEDFTVGTDNQSVHQVAAATLDHLGWR